MDRKAIGKHKRTHAGSYWEKHRTGGGRWLQCVLANLEAKRRSRRRRALMFDSIADAMAAQKGKS